MDYCKSFDGNDFCLTLSNRSGEKIYVSGVLRWNGNGNAISPNFYRINDKMMMSVSKSKFNHFLSNGSCYCCTMVELEYVCVAS